MLTRQIQKTGGSSFSIILPKDWVSRNKLNKKDILNIYQLESDDLLIKKNTSTITSTKIEVDKVKINHIIREILSCYVRGYQEIILTSKGPFLYEVREILRKARDLMFGFETFDENSNSIILKNVSTNNISSEIYINKIMSNICDMYADLESAFKTFDQKLAQDIIQRDNEIDKINFLIMRKSISEIKSLGTDEILHTTPMGGVFNQLRSSKLERIADHIVKLATLISENDPLTKSMINKTDLLILVSGRKYLELCQKLIRLSNKNTANNIIDLSQIYRKNQAKLKFDYSKMHYPNILIKNSVERIRSYIVNIAEDTINFYV